MNGCEQIYSSDKASTILVWFDVDIPIDHPKCDEEYIVKKVALGLLIGAVVALSAVVISGQLSGASQNGEPVGISIGI